MDERVASAFEMLVERMTNMEQSLGALMELQRYEQDGMPQGTVLCGCLYRPGSLAGELTIRKEYGGSLPCGDSSLVVATVGDVYLGGFWWRHTLEWSRGEARTWVDDAVEAEIGVEAAAAVRGRCRGVLEAAAEGRPEEGHPDEGHPDVSDTFIRILCGDVGMVGRGAPDPREDLRHAWFRTAIVRAVPGVLDMAGDYVLVRAGTGVASAVALVDRAFDRCGEPRTPEMTLRLLDPVLTELAGFLAVSSEDETDPQDVADLKERFDALPEERRHCVLCHLASWRARRTHMTPEQVDLDDRASFLSFQMLETLL